MSKYLPIPVGGSIPFWYDNFELNPELIYI